MHIHIYIYIVCVRICIHVWHVYIYTQYTYSQFMRINLQTRRDHQEGVEDEPGVPDVAQTMRHDPEEELLGSMRALVGSIMEYTPYPYP